MNPLVSVVMPVWNGEKYLAPAIAGILAQTFGDFEFIIVDDGSSDSTPAILQSYADPRIRVIRLDHVGIVTALNCGIAQARGAWIARQDADDISLPRRLEMQWAALARNPKAVLSHTDVEYIFEGNSNTGFAAGWPGPIHKPRLNSHCSPRKALQNALSARSTSRYSDNHGNREMAFPQPGIVHGSELSSVG
jgi:glycosyltransferase involved in cell wall biosynthesis